MAGLKNKQVAVWYCNDAFMAVQDEAKLQYLMPRWNCNQNHLHRSANSFNLSARGSWRKKIS
jgi:hypothetical protein